jgi:hypothetical protein
MYDIMKGYDILHCTYNIMYDCIMKKYDIIHDVIIF